jgi:hypothetical protein
VAGAGGKRGIGSMGCKGDPGPMAWGVGQDGAVVGSCVAVAGWARLWNRRMWSAEIGGWKGTGNCLIDCLISD